MSSPIPSHENEDQLLALLGGLCNQTLTDRQICQLDRILMESDKSRRIYEEYLFLHAQLYTELASDDDGDTASETRIDLPESLPPAAASGNVRYGGRENGHLRMLAPLLAAMFFGIVAVASWRGGLFSSEDRVADRKAAVSPQLVVAHITSTQNCRWGGSKAHIGFGSQLHPGQELRLEAGLAEVTFVDGARVTLEGPSEFRVDATDEGKLLAGRLTAAVPVGARGFGVTANSVHVVDLGTEFGLVASDAGATEIHVFNGLVEAQLLDQSGVTVRSISLQTHEAAVVDNATAKVRRVAARDNDFIRGISRSARPHQDLYAYEGFDYPAGPLAWQNGGFGWAGPWVNIEAAADSENSNLVVTGNLVYEGVAPSGNHAGQVSQYNRIRRALSTSLGGVFDTAQLVENQDGQRLIGRDGTVVYLSFLQRVSQTDSGFYGLELHRGDGNGNRVVCVGNGAEGTGYGVTSNYNLQGKSYAPQGSLPFPTLGEEDAGINFIVLKVSYGQGHEDVLEVFRNPASLVDESLCRSNATLRGNFAFDRVSFGNFDGTKVHEVDELRIGTSFVAVAGRQPVGTDLGSPDLALRKMGERFGQERTDRIARLLQLFSCLDKI